MAITNKKTHPLHITLRVLTALIGGFVLANLVAILIAQWSPNENVDAIVAGMMTSFIVYTFAVMFVFSTKTVRSAAFGIISLCLITYCLINFLNPGILI